MTKKERVRKEKKEMQLASPNSYYLFLDDQST